MLLTKSINMPNRIYMTALLGLCTVFFAVCRVNGQQAAFFLTDAHRGLVPSAWQDNLKLITIGEREKKFLVDPQGDFWNDYLVKGRFNEESCASTNRPFSPLRLLPGGEILGVKEGDTFQIGDWKHHVLETPGMSRGSVSYDSDGTVYTGDLIYGDGKIANLYDLQDNFPEADIGPYHGFMARAPHLIASLEKIRAIKPTRLVPADNQVIENPNDAIDTLIARLRAVYRNYLSTCALWWYFGENRMNASAAAILGDEFDPAKLDRMPEAKKYENPDWLTGFSTTRMIRSETGDVFVMDVGDDGVAERIIGLHKSGKIRNVTGIFVTHYHHDHNTGVPKVADFFDAAVSLADILERPGAYRMPCLQNIVVPVVRKSDGETMRWNEFEFTFFDFPGQTLYHNALLVRKVVQNDSERPILFIGDSFTPTGIDDYCAWNRNLLKDGKGYLYCLEKIRSLDPAPLLVNAHVDPPFEFDAARLDYIEHALRERMKLLVNLLAVPEINFGLDHAWCRFDPFVAEFKPGESILLKMVITNHFDKPFKFQVELEPGDEFPFQITPSDKSRTLSVEPGKEHSISWTLNPTDETAKLGFLSAKVTTEGGSLTGRCEAVFQMRNEK